MNPTDSRPTLPTGIDGIDSGTERCTARLVNGDLCGREQNPERPSVCVNNHFWRGNPGRSTDRSTDPQREQRVAADRDRHLRDLGWIPVESAPLHVSQYCTNLAELAMQVEDAARRKRSEYPTLLIQYHKLASLWSQYKKPKQEHGTSHLVEGKSIPELLGMFVDTLRPEELETLADIVRRRTEALRCQTDGREAVLPTLHTQDNSDSRESAPQSQTPPSDSGSSSTVPEPLPAVRTEGARLDPRSISAVPTATAPEPSSVSGIEPTPVLYVHNRRITEADVLRCLSDFGDQEVEDYKMGRLSKARAYKMAAAFIRNSGGFGASIATKRDDLV